MARDFNSADKITYTVDASQASLTQVSYSFWFIVDGNGQYKNFFHSGADYPDTDFNLEFDDGWGLVFAAYRGASGDTGTGKWSIAKPSTGTLYHFALTYDWGSTANDPIFYLNGVSQGVTERTAPSGTPRNTSTNFKIGSDVAVTAAGSMDGRMSDFAFWNRILTQAEVTLLSKAFSPLFLLKGLVFSVDLIRGVNDRMKGIVGALTNTTVTVHPRIIYPKNYFSTFVPSAAAPPASIPLLSLMGIGM